MVEGKSNKLHDILLNLSASINPIDPSPVVSDFARVFQGAAMASVLTNVCKYCGRHMTYAGKVYILNTIIPAIMRHPNLNFKADWEYKGSLGIPKRYTLKNVESYLMKVFNLKVTACGKKTELLTLVQAQTRSKGGREGDLGKESVARLRAGKIDGSKQDRFLSLKLDNFAEKAYKNTAFSAGGERGRPSKYKRNWLKEADTGETDVSGYDVFPRKGDPRSTYRSRKLKARKGRRRPDQTTLGDYSRSGTHIMIKGSKGYDPNDWRPDPNENNAIRNTFMKHLPGLIKKVRLSIPSCLGRIKSRIKADTVKIIKEETPKVKRRTSSGDFAISNEDALRKSVSAASPGGNSNDIVDVRSIMATAEVDFNLGMSRAAKFLATSAESLTKQVSLAANLPSIGTQLNALRYALKLLVPLK